MDDMVVETTLAIDKTASYIDTAGARSPESSSGSSGDVPGDEGHGQQGAELLAKRKRPRKRKCTKWKPYDELSWVEKKVQDDLETKRAYAKRDKLCAEGHPIAPYNTTQFLMADHRKSTPNLIRDGGEETMIERKFPRENSTATPVKSRSNTDQDYLSITNEIGSFQEFIMDDFSHTYAGIHAEYLQTLTKTDLITEYLQMEKKVEQLEKKLKDTKRKHKENAASADGMKILLDKINHLQEQNKQLQNSVGAIPGLPLSSEDGNGSAGSVGC